MPHTLTRTAPVCTHPSPICRSGSGAGGLAGSHGTLLAFIVLVAAAGGVYYLRWRGRRPGGSSGVELSSQPRYVPMLDQRAPEDGWGSGGGGGGGGGNGGANRLDWEEDW